MDSKRLKLLERAFEAEVEGALNQGLHMMQTKSALAETMVEEGLLAKVRVKESGVTIEGYELTHVGRMTYCMECRDEVVECMKINEATGVGDWCAPGPANEQSRKWLLVFDDPDMGQNLYDNEADAREAFSHAEGRGWNCHLFQHAPRIPPNADIGSDDIKAG